MPATRRGSVTVIALLAVLLAAVVAQNALGAAPPLKVLLLSGSNNHDWKTTTPALKKIYEASGRFTVDVTDDPSRSDAAMLAKYDVIVSNWSGFPDMNGRQWGERAEKAFLDFVGGGKGFVLFHAASATFHTWPEYQKLAGATWGAATGHGTFHAFKVTVTDTAHPVTRGMKDFYITDELWHRMQAHADRHVLCTAASAKAEGGSGLDEPVVLTTQLGKGRGLNVVLGHDTKTMENVAWQTLMLRGTEWAATGEVTIPIPAAWPASAGPSGQAQSAERERPAYAWQKTDTSIALMNRGRAVWQFNYPKGDGKPYFHPVNLVDGTPLTWNSPPDHPWHRALWFSWKFIDGVNYWEEDPKTGQTQGRNELVSVSAAGADDFSARIAMTIAYHPPDKPAVMTEERVLTVSAPDADGRYWIDWQTTFRAGAKDVVLDRTPIRGEPNGVSWGGYAGLSVRLAKTLGQWRVLNSDALEDLKANEQNARWVDFSGVDADTRREGGMVILDHPGNLRHPSPWYVIMDPKAPFGYFSPALLFRQALTLPAGKALPLRYRIIVHPGRPTKDQLDGAWQVFATSPARAEGEGTKG